MWYLVIAAAASFGLLALTFCPLERAYPSYPKQAIFRSEWATDLAFFLGQYLIWSFAAVGILELLRETLAGVIPQHLQVWTGGLPLWLKFGFAVLAGDFCVYWIHRLQHRVPLLWRFHMVHHTAEKLDWIAAHREHPIDGVVTQLALNLPALLLGFSFSGMSAFIALRGIWALFIHSNVRLPLGFLKYIMGSPELHHWHHTRSRKSCNYGNLCPWMDLLFGTYSCPGREPTELGVTEPTPRTYLGLLLYPFCKRK